jgi:Zn-dependent protease
MPERCVAPAWFRKEYWMIGKGLRVGRFYGIDIILDWSWLLIFILVFWNLTNVFGQLHPDWGSGLRTGLALAAALLFFLSVLAHELAHALVARANGLPVKNITLFLFGGVANIQREPPSARVEFWMAIAGPLTSLFIGGGLLGISVGSLRSAAAVGAPGAVLAGLSPLATLLVWLGAINIVLAAFNMIPGFPLDGGRVLRSVLWGITNSLRRATRWAAWIGQGIAWIMILLGIAMIIGIQIPYLGNGLVNGIWMIFIGWFLNNASAQSYQQVALRDMLEGVPVTRLMRRDPPTIGPGCTVADLILGHSSGNDDQAFPVLDDNVLVGIVTLDDARRVGREAWDTTCVRDVMTPEEKLVTISPEEDVSEAVDKLVQRGVRQLPVVYHDCQFVGLLRRRDVMRWLQLQTDIQGGKL